MKIIEIKNYVPKGVKVLSGRELGKDLRKKLKIVEFDKNNEEMTFVIPEEYYSVNSSFFLGFLGQSVRELGERKFREKYKFDCDGILMKNIDDGISRALKESNVLRGS